MKQEERWNVMYEAAKEYYKEYGNLAVPYNYTTKDGKNLGSWISAIRNCYKGNKSSVLLTEERVKKLNDIEMVWDIHLSNWRSMYEEAKEYYDTTGDLLVPQAYITKEGSDLGGWISYQREIYNGKKKKNLTSEQIKLLNDIKMVWTDVNEVRWNRNFELVRKYYQRTGSFPQKNMGLPLEMEKLATWFRGQKLAYFKKKLSKERMIKMASLGIKGDFKIINDFTSYLDFLSEEYHLNIDYALNEKVLRHISYLEFQSKMTYLLEHKTYPLDKEGKLIKMFTMASKDLEREYHITLEELITNYRSKEILIKKK